MQTMTCEALHAAIGDDGVAVVTLAMPGHANAINATLMEGLEAVLDWIEGQPEVVGVVWTSAHRDFCVGADLNMILGERDPGVILEAARRFHRVHRRVEAGPPSVCALNGSALGGGYELALACHHRVAVDAPTLQVGLPEVLLGVIPGGGGTQRLPRLLGIQAALELITQGSTLRAGKAKAKGLIDALVPDASGLIPAAKEWITAHRGARQPWDRPGFRWPGVRPGSDEARNLFLAASAMAFKKTAGAFPAVQAAITATHEGGLVGIDAALEVEARHFAGIVVSDQAKDMIRTLFFHKQAVERQTGLPQVPASGFHKVAVLGAGMMGAGIAFLCAKAGARVVLKDIRPEAVEAGEQHVRAQVAGLKHLDDAARRAIADRITVTLDLEAVRGADLVIEAVVEDLGVKHRVVRETEPLLAEGAVWASNTSALPITDLAQASANPDRFIGLHFFSPVEKMPLLEIIRGAATSDETLARCLAFGRAIKKTCIVVNDAYGFFTTNVFSAYILEGAELVAEGQDPRRVEWAARAAGMVVGPLQVFDEVTLSLGQHALTQGAAYLGDWVLDLPGVQLVMRLVEAGRPGKAGGAGFYDYDKGKRRGLWPGLAELASAGADPLSVEAIGERLLLAQVAAAGRCLDQGVIRHPRDAEIGAVFGVGFAPNTGGPLTLVDRLGVAEIVSRLEALTATHGPRFAPAETFRRMARKQERFFPAV